MYLGHDVATEQELVKLPSGGVLRSKSISSGLMTVGNLVPVVVPIGSANAIADKMPHG